MHSSSSAVFTIFARAQERRRVRDVAPVQGGVQRHRVLVERDRPVRQRVAQRLRALGPFDRQRIVHVVGRELGRDALGERRVEVRRVAVGGDDRDHPLMGGAGGVGGRRARTDRVGDVRAGRAAPPPRGPAHPARRRPCDAARAACGRRSRSSLTAGACTRRSRSRPGSGAGASSGSGAIASRSSFTTSGWNSGCG